MSGYVGHTINNIDDATARAAQTVARLKGITVDDALMPCCLKHVHFRNAILNL